MSIRQVGRVPCAVAGQPLVIHSAGKSLYLPIVLLGGMVFRYLETNRSRPFYVMRSLHGM